MHPCDLLETSKWYNHPKLVLIFSHFMAGIVFPLHLLGAFCILKRTPSSMSSVKWTILNLHFWNILVDCLMNIFVIPCPLLPTASGYLLGVFNLMGISGLVQSWILTTSLSVVCVSTTMIFENRFYLLMAKNTKWKYIRPIWMGANFIFCLTFTIPIIAQVPDQENAKNRVFDSLECVPDFLLSSQIEIITLTLDGFVFIFTATGFFLVVFGQLIGFAIVITIHLSSANLMSENTRSLQKNLLKALILQTGIPFVYLLMPVAVAGYAIAFGIFSLAANNLIIIVAAFHGLVSSGSMIFIHHPYRKTVLKLFERSSSRVSTNLTVS